MNTSAIVAIIMGVLMMVLSFVLFPTLNSAMDDLMLYWVDSCELNNERFVRAYAGATSGTADNTYISGGDEKGNFYGSGKTVGLYNGACGVINGVANRTGSVTLTPFNDGLYTGYYNERGKSISFGAVLDATGSSPSLVATAPIAAAATNYQPVTNAKWINVPSILDQFGGIGRLVLSVMPIMVLASFLGLVAMGLIEYGRGMSQGGIAGSVGAAIIQLIVVIVLLEVLPTVIDAMVDANQSATGGSLTVNQQFSGIMAIIFAALPLLLVVGILGISGFMLFQKGRSFRGSGGFSLGG